MNDEGEEKETEQFVKFALGLLLFYPQVTQESMQSSEDAFLRSTPPSATQNFPSYSQIAKKKCLVYQEIYWFWFSNATFMSAIKNCQFLFVRA